MLRDAAEPGEEPDARSRRLGVGRDVDGAPGRGVYRGGGALVSLGSCCLHASGADLPPPEEGWDVQHVARLLRRRGLFLLLLLRLYPGALGPALVG